MVEVTVELLLPVDSVEACGGRVSVDLPDGVPALEEEMLECDLIVRVILGVGVPVIPENAQLNSDYDDLANKIGRQKTLRKIHLIFFCVYPHHITQVVSGGFFLPPTPTTNTVQLPPLDLLETETSVEWLNQL